MVRVDIVIEVWLLVLIFAFLLLSSLHTVQDWSLKMYTCNVKSSFLKTYVKSISTWKSDFKTKIAIEVNGEL